MMTSDLQLWRSENGERWFLVPRQAGPIEGEFLIRTISGELACVSEEWAASHEVDQDQGRAWAKDELSKTLDALKGGVDEKLADLHQRVEDAKQTPVSDDTSITPDAVPALFALLKNLPGLIGNSLSGDGARVDRASSLMADLQRGLVEAGINVDARFASFPDRLAGLRAEFAARKAAPPPPAVHPAADD
jgi:hypothetical protein